MHYQTNNDRYAFLSSIGELAHEFGHTIKLGHYVAGPYDLMFWGGFSARREYFSPPHINPRDKILFGWIQDANIYKINSNSSLQLQPITNSQSVALITVYGDAGRHINTNPSDNYDHSEYLIIEYRKREGFNRFTGGIGATGFIGGGLIWHYSSSTLFPISGDFVQTHLGLKVQNYNNSFMAKPGDPSQLFYPGNPSLNSSSSLNSNSAGNLTTGINLSSFSYSGGNLVFNVNYDLGTPPNYSFVVSRGYDINNNNFHDNVFIDGSQTYFPNLTIGSGTNIEFAPGADIVITGPNTYLSADANGQTPITIDAVGYGSYRNKWNKITLEFPNTASTISNCVIKNSQSGIYIANPLQNITFSNNTFQNNTLDIFIDKEINNYGAVFPSFTNNTFAKLKIRGNNWEINPNQLISIPVGSTLEIIPQSSLKFGLGSGLLIKGTLNASNITFTSLSGTAPGSWGSITFDGASQSGLNNITMKYGNEIQVINVPSITIQYSLIENTINGIRFYGSNGWIIENTIKNVVEHGIIGEGGSTPACYSNIIFKNPTNAHYHSGAGILYTSGSSDYIWHNDIAGFNWGVGTIYSSSPHFGHPNNGGTNNRITDCFIGLEVYNNCYPVVGIIYYNSNYYNGNSIYGNGLSAEVRNNSTVYAHNAYWGPSYYPSYYTDYSSSFYAYPYILDIDPWAPFPLPNQSTTVPPVLTKNDLSKTVSTTSDQSLTSTGSDQKKKRLFEGIAYREQKKHKEAFTVFSKMITDNEESEAALVELYNTYSDTTKEDVFKYFKTASKEKYPFASHLLSSLHVKRGEIKEAKAVNESIIKKYPNTDDEKHAKIQQLYIALYQENNFTAASSLFTDIQKQKNADKDIEVRLAQHALDSYVNVNGAKGANRLKKESKEIEQIPTEYAIMQNYPNPFNPSTVINYQLPMSNHVSLKVYDALGREVATLVNEIKEVGSYSIVFDASKLASGLYFYSIKAGNYKAVKKMSLIK